MYVCASCWLANADLECAKHLRGIRAIHGSLRKCFTNSPARMHVFALHSNVYFWILSHWKRAMPFILCVFIPLFSAFRFVSLLVFVRRMYVTLFFRRWTFLSRDEKSAIVIWRIGHSWVRSYLHTEISVSREIGIEMEFQRFAVQLSVLRVFFHARRASNPNAYFLILRWSVGCAHRIDAIFCVAHGQC